MNIVSLLNMFFQQWEEFYHERLILITAIILQKSAELNEERPNRLLKPENPY